MDHPPPDYAATLLKLLTAADFRRASFGGKPRFAAPPAQRVTVRPVELRGGRRLQVSRFDGRKDLSTNHTAAELPAALADVLAAGFANVHIATATEEIDLRLTKKGDLLLGRKLRAEARGLGRSPAPAPHNRPKDVPLPEGRADSLLEALAILDRNGRVRPTMRDKFTQINEFLKLLDHVLPEVIASRTPEDHPQPPSPGIAIPGPTRELLILDCGCGSSHLTLATAHFLTTIKHLPARVVGIDQNPEVIAKSRAHAANLPHLQIEFRQAPIGTITDLSPHIVLALHACDTATDDAIAQAIRSRARLLLAVPCCHNYLNTRLNIPDLAPIHHQGILHQRLADIITDTFRALLLEVMGYRAEVIEFISPEHTARNLMIRAVRVHDAGAPAALDHYHRFKSFTGVVPYLETALAPMLPALAQP
jgi:SAM-dependent methyltransferase